MKNIVIYLVLVTLSITGVSKGQTLPITPLKIGDKVPDIFFDQIIGYTRGNSHISELYKNRLLILDFWFTGCSVCIIQFPYLTELQKIFKKNVLILPVGFDAFRTGSIIDFIEKRKGTGRALSLPTVVIKKGDSLLNRLFPFSGLPVEVWIDSNGVLRAITDHTCVNEKNIKGMLNDSTFRLPTASYKRILSNNDGFRLSSAAEETDLLAGSIITKSIDTLGSTIPFETEFGSYRKRLLNINYTMVDLYKCAYWRKEEELDKRILIEGDTINFFHDWSYANKISDWKYKEFKERNTFCYEQIFSSNISFLAAENKMISDLDSFFSIDSYIEKRKMPCLKLVRISSSRRFNIFEEGRSQYSEDQLEVTLRDEKVSALITHLNYLIPNILVIDDTRFNGNIFIHVSLSKDYTLKEIRKSLKIYDLDLIESVCDTNVLVLKRK